MARTDSQLHFLQHLTQHRCFLPQRNVRVTPLLAMASARPIF
jgi:hypothetical protein